MPFLVLIGSTILLQLVLVFAPRRVDLLIPPAERKERQTGIAASPWIMVALLICCSARNTARVGDLHPASFKSSVRFVSFRMVVISACSFQMVMIIACSWPSHPSERYTHKKVKNHYRNFRALFCLLVVSPSLTYSSDVCVFVLLCFVDPILGNRYGPGVIP